MQKNQKSKSSLRKSIQRDKGMADTVRAKMEFYDSMPSGYFQGHVLDKLCCDLIDYASQPNSYDIETFRRHYGIPYCKWENLLRYNQVLREKCDFARELIESNILAAKGIEGYSKLLYQISDRWKKAEEYHAGLKHIESSTETQKVYENVFGGLPIKKESDVAENK